MDRKSVVLFLIMFYVFTYGIWIELWGINNPYRFFIYVLIVVPAILAVFSRSCRDSSMYVFMGSMFFFALLFFASMPTDLLSLYNYVFVPLVFFAGLLLLSSKKPDNERKYFFQLLIMISLFGACNSMVSIFEAFTNQILLTSGSEHTILDETGAMRSRANGLIGSSLVNGCLCGITVITSLYLYLLKKYRIITLTIAFVSIVALLATLSRGPLVGTVCGLTVLYWEHIKKFSFVKLGFVVVIGYLAINYIVDNSDDSLLLSRIVSIFNWKTDGGNTQRINVWTTALAIVRDDFFFGMGVGALKQLKIAVTESGVLYVFFETGIIGLIVYFIPIFTVVLKKHNFGKNPDSAYRICLAVITLILVENIVLQVMTSLVIQLTVGLFMAKIIIQRKADIRKKSHIRKKVNNNFVRVNCE